jgi:hypothetical protein
VKRKIRKQLAKRKSQIQNRLDPLSNNSDRGPVLGGGNVHYEIADKVRGVIYGGIGMIDTLGRKLGLPEAIDERLQLFKRHAPYHESDHVLNIAHNLLCGGECLEDIETRRNDEVYLDAVGAVRIPDPTTAGDFCRRFKTEDVLGLQYAYDKIRLRVWKQQPKAFFEQAIIDADGTMTPTTGQCKDGMDINYKGEWGYHPLIVSLANTGEPLRIVNRSGNRPSHEGAHAMIDDAVDLCRLAGFQNFLLRGDTDFTQTAHLDGWDDDSIDFVFGSDGTPNLKDLADQLPKDAWKTLVRRQKRPVADKPRARPDNVKQQVVVERNYENIVLQGEQVAEFDYQPGKCKRPYRMVVIRKDLSVERGGQWLFDDYRYFFYITNDNAMSVEEIVFTANDRCDQENLIGQLKSGVPALRSPVDNLTSNWAYMVMASLAWNLKAWAALMLTESGRWREKHREEKRTVLRMGFKRFLDNFIPMPCQIIRSGRRTVFRLLSWNPWLSIFFRLTDMLRC